MALEARLLRSDRKIEALVVEREDILRALNCGLAPSVPFGGTGLRWIIAIENEIGNARSAREELQGKLLSARARENALAGKALRIREALERKVEEARALEAVVILTRKPAASPS
ncbi:MAG: hypothetical protein ACK4HL_01945 [Aestuariivirga sp.]